jgi:predicted DNA-binding transcriptional regulator AlpA
MNNDTDDQAQPALWGVPDSEQFATPARRPARARTRPAPTESGGEVGELWTIDQVADYLGVPKQTIYGGRTTGYGPHGFRVGKHLRWRATTVLAWTADLERDQ